MSKVQYYASIDPEGLVCLKCNVPLEKKEVHLEYIGNGFPVELPRCPKCNMAYVPEDLATDKIFSVERQLEDK